MSDSGIVIEAFRNTAQVAARPAIDRVGIVMSGVGDGSPEQTGARRQYGEINAILAGPKIPVRDEIDTRAQATIIQDIRDGQRYSATSLDNMIADKEPICSQQHVASERTKNTIPQYCD